jgi:hypothetical protein
MKTFTIRFLRGAAVTGLAAFLCIGSALAADQQSLAQIFEQGRAAYHRGDFVTAQTLLSKVAAAKPDHFETRAMLANIQSQNKAPVSVQKTYEAIVLPKVDFQEATLTEAAQALSLLGKNAANGKVSPNIIVKPKAGEGAKITLTLQNVPLTEAIRYIADLSQCKASYDKHAVVIAGLSD